MISLFCKLDFNNRLELHDYIDIEISKEILNNLENKMVCFIYEDYSEVFIGLKVGYKHNTRKGIFKVLSKGIKLKEKNKEKVKSILKDNEIKKIEEDILPEIELVIENLIDYMVICKHMNQSNILYRGQSNRLWDLTPSVFRNKIDTNSEKQLYKDLLQWNDDQFSSDDFVVNACNMQHYGIPTRLLDWTSNPLHSLYFACSGSSGKDVDAQVTMLKAREIFDIDSDEYESIDKFIEYRYRLNCKTKNIDEIFWKLTVNEREHLFFRSLYSNNRVKTQQGYFSIYVDLTEKESQMVRKFEMDNILKEVYKEIQRITGFRDNDKYAAVSIDIINNITSRQNLDEFINKSAEIMEMRLAIPKGRERKINIKDIIQKEIEKSGYHKLVQRENNMKIILEKEKYIKIIIKNDIKKCIIDSLDSYGINSRSIYPDIEGLSRYMRERYQ